MKAMRLHGPGEPLRADAVAVPDVAPGQMLLRVDIAAV
jgi:hypothetical protein